MCIETRHLVDKPRIVETGPHDNSKMTIFLGSFMIIEVSAGDILVLLYFLIAFLEMISNSKMIQL